MSTFEFSDEEVIALNSSILNRYGLDFSGYESQSYKRRLHRIIRIHKLDNTIDLWRKMLTEPDFIHEYVDQLSVGLTSFFRDPVMWIGLRDYLSSLSPRPKLKVWHAGCSTGEEVFSFGVLLQELGWNMPIEIHATDISQAALQKAKDGVFHDLQVEEYRKNYEAFNPTGDMVRHCTPVPGGGIRMHQRLIRNVTFYQHNLVKDPYPRGFDIVFCRNVMIYFDTPTKQRIAPLFHEALKPGGLFSIGFFDALTPLLAQYQFRQLSAKTKLFVKSDK